MFTLTGAIFALLLDLIVCAFLIGAAIIVLAFIIFIVTGIITAMLPSKNPKGLNNK